MKTIQGLQRMFLWLALGALVGCAGRQAIPLRVYPLAFDAIPPGLGRLEMLDADGKAVRTLFDRRALQGAVTLEWDGRDAKGKTLPSGEYDFRLVTTSYRLDPLADFGGVGSSPGRFLAPRGLSAAPQGARLTLAVADTGNHRVQLLTDTGAPLQTAGQFGVGEGRLNQPTAVHWDGQILTVCDSQNRRLARFDSGGGYLGEVRRLTGTFPESTPNAPRDFRRPTDLLPSDGGTFWVSDPANGTLSRITPSGGLLSYLGGGAPLDLAGPLLRWPDGTFWLAGDHGVLRRLEEDGTVRDNLKVPDLGKVGGMALGDGFALVADERTGKLFLLDRDGQVFGVKTLAGVERPGALALFQDRLFVVDVERTRIHAYRLTREEREYKRTVTVDAAGTPESR